VNGRGQILALTSSKGGVGKTHLAVSLSAALAKRSARVLLIDADLGNGIISDRLGLEPKYNLAHFFLKERVLEDLVEETPFGFSLIAGERGNLELANLNYLQQMKFLRSFVGTSRRFDFVVLDLGSGIRRQALDFALFADRTIIVTSPDDLMSAYGSARGCLFRFMELETTLFQRIDGYAARRFFRPFILTGRSLRNYYGPLRIRLSRSRALSEIRGGTLPSIPRVGLFKGGHLHRRNGHHHLWPISLQGLLSGGTPPLHHSDPHGKGGEFEERSNPRGNEDTPCKNSLLPLKPGHCQASYPLLTDPRELLAKGHIDDSGSPSRGSHDNAPRVIRDDFADDLGIPAMLILPHCLKDPEGMFRWYKRDEPSLVSDVEGIQAKDFTRGSHFFSYPNGSFDEHDADP